MLNVKAMRSHAAVELVRERPDVVLMDIQLPGTDGLALTWRNRIERAGRSRSDEWTLQRRYMQLEGLYQSSTNAGDASLQYSA